MITDFPAHPTLFVNNSSEAIEDPFGTVIGPDREVQYPGITARDYFAAQVIGGLIHGMAVTAYPERAERAYALADAMLAARGEKS